MRTQSTGFQTVGSWLGRIFRLDFSAFAEIRANPSATTAAIVVVLVASLFAGLGSWLWALQNFGDNSDTFIRSFLLGSVIQTVMWFSWVYIVYLVLTWGYGARQEFGELTRAMGFAFAPVALSVLVFIGALAVPIGLISFAVTVLFTNAAIQQVSDAEVDEATVANVAGFGVFAVVMGGCANIFEVDGIGGLAPGIFFFSLDL
ncbi:MAG TPA: YIP1 family protein [Dehalococcoidia bacterium]|nr:YIP1 family protein [Dehalococcoidia bacterium]